MAFRRGGCDVFSPNTPAPRRAFPAESVAAAPILAFKCVGDFKAGRTWIVVAFRERVNATAILRNAAGNRLTAGILRLGLTFYLTAVRVQVGSQ